MNLDKLDSYDISSVKSFYDYTKKPNITVDDCRIYAKEHLSANAMINGLNLVDGDTYFNLLPLNIVGKLEVKDPNYVKQTGLFNHQEAHNACQKAYNACEVSSKFPKALLLNEIREHAYKAVKEISEADKFIFYN